MRAFTAIPANTLFTDQQAEEGTIERRSTNTNKHKSKKSKSIGSVQTDESQSQSPAIDYTRAYEIRNPLNKIRLTIKNMVSIRCKMIVMSELAKLGIHDAIVQLGEVEIKEDLSPANHDKFKAGLKKFGFELLEDKRSMLIEKIKNMIVEMVHYTDELPVTNFSDYLSENLNHCYNYLSNLFSEVMGITIEHYIIYHKIEKVKELLMYDELTLTEISYNLNYSSVAHLSNQFKKVTGLTPSHFKRLKHKRRKALEDV